MKLNITRKKKTESISVENNRVNEIRKETQLDLNLELSDFPIYCPMLLCLLMQLYIGKTRIRRKAFFQL